jgi:very-short-patch-repair endonuclease
MVLRLTEAEYRRLKRGEKSRGVRGGTRWEEEFDLQLAGAGLAGRYSRELRFRADRRFRFDFAFLPEMLAVEIDGAVHRIKKRFHSDVEKSQLAILGGWRVLRVSPAQVRSGHALALVCKLLR